MDRKAWQAIGHGVTKELDMTEVTWHICLHTRPHSWCFGEPFIISL